VFLFIGIGIERYREGTCSSVGRVWELSSRSFSLPLVLLLYENHDA
jgi:hypothetical protein